MPVQRRDRPVQVHVMSNRAETAAANLDGKEYHERTTKARIVEAPAAAAGPAPHVGKVVALGTSRTRDMAIQVAFHGSEVSVLARGGAKIRWLRSAISDNL